MIAARLFRCCQLREWAIYLLLAFAAARFAELRLIATSPPATISPPAASVAMSYCRSRRLFDCCALPSRRRTDGFHLLSRPYRERLFDIDWRFAEAMATCACNAAA